jgi:hypothetical protein
VRVELLQASRTFTFDVASGPRIRLAHLFGHEMVRGRIDALPQQIVDG